MPAPPGSSAGAGGDDVEQGEKIALAIIWEGEDFLDSANQPFEYDFLRAPGGVAFVELLEGDWFFPCSVVLVVGLEDVVDGAKEMSSHLLSLSWPPWTIPMKSSRYTLTWARATARACGNRAHKLLSASSVASESSAEVCGGLVSAKSSR